MLRRGPRTYKVFICHRYDDDEIYILLRQHLLSAPRFSWKNLSIQLDQSLDESSRQSLKNRITRTMKQADVILVFAHSAGEWIEHEVESAGRYDLPLISIVDPQRAGDKHRKVRSSLILSRQIAEAALDQPGEIVDLIRKHARPQVARLIKASVARQTPKDIAKNLGAAGTRKGWLDGLGSIASLAASPKVEKHDPK